MILTTPCGAAILSQDIFTSHVLACPEPRCAEYGADVLLALAAFRRGGAKIDLTLGCMVKAAQHIEAAE